MYKIKKRQMRQSTSNPCKHWAETCPTFFLKMRQKNETTKLKIVKPLINQHFPVNYIHCPTFKKVRQKVRQ